MITLYDPIHITTGTLTPISKDVGMMGVYYLCDHKSDHNNGYNGRLPVLEKELEFLKKTSKKMKRDFYRVGNIESEQGLWYDMAGNFTGLIHNKYNFCKNAALQMPFDEKLQGYLSVVPDLIDLFEWFSIGDIKRLEEFGYRCMRYSAIDYKWHNNHWLINKNTSKLEKIITV